MLAGPRIDGGLVVVEESALLDCRGSEPRPRTDTLNCDLKGVWTVLNPTDQAQTAMLSFYRRGVKGWSLSSGRDGELQGRPLVTPEPTAGSKPSANPDPLQPWVDAAPHLEVEGVAVDLSLDAGEQVTLTATGQMLPQRPNAPGDVLLWSAVTTRHFLLASSDFCLYTDEGCLYSLDWLPTPQRAPLLGGSPLRVMHPGLWSLVWGYHPEPYPNKVAPLDPARWPALNPSSSVAGATPASMHNTEHSADAGPPGETQYPRLLLDLHTPPSLFFGGGPKVALAWNSAYEAHLWGRFGYEVASPYWLLHSLNVDTDFVDALVFAAVSEAATLGFISVPSLGVGGGPVVRVLPDVSAGIRLQVSIQWPIVGAVLGMDIYPQDTHPVQLIVGGQMGF